MATIEKYTFEPAALECGTKLPVSKMVDRGLYEALDAIAEACEAGKLDDDKWVKQCFKTKNDFKAFLEDLETYDVCYRINDRWYQALQQLTGGPGDEEGFVTSAEIADGLQNHAVSTGQWK